jgi:hypothetical protein
MESAGIERRSHNEIKGVKIKGVIDETRRNFGGLHRLLYRGLLLDLRINILKCVPLTPILLQLLHHITNNLFDLTITIKEDKNIKKHKQFRKLQSISKVHECTSGMGQNK